MNRVVGVGLAAAAGAAVLIVISAQTFDWGLIDDRSATQESGIRERWRPLS